MLLLDTHVIIWWTFNPEKLSRKAAIACKRIEETGGIVSSISIWEIGIKINRGKLDLGMSIDEYYEKLSIVRGIEIVAVDTQTWLENLRLNWEHKDPVDRTLVALARIKKIPIVTKDKEITSFLKNTIW